LISPISVSWSARPIPVGSIAYSAGRTTVTRITIAAMIARIVDLISCALDGSSARVGMSLLYMEPPQAAAK
jgi:hypothetical protein